MKYIVDRADTRISSKFSATDRQVCREFLVMLCRKHSFARFWSFFVSSVASYCDMRCENWHALLVVFYISRCKCKSQAGMIACRGPARRGQGQDKTSKAAAQLSENYDMVAAKMKAVSAGFFAVSLFQSVVFRFFSSSNEK